MEHMLVMKSITIRAQFVVEELYSGYNTYNNKSYLLVRKEKLYMIWGSPQFVVEELRWHT